MPITFCHEFNDEDLTHRIVFRFGELEVASSWHPDTNPVILHNENKVYLAVTDRCDLDVSPGIYELKAVR